MALYKDESERLARIEQLLTEARLKRVSLRPADHQLRRELGFHLDTLLNELLGPVPAPKQAPTPTR